MVAFHYPPEGSSSGVQRTLSFTRNLGENGWSPMVLTAHPRAYSVRRMDQVGDIPPGILVRRACAFDSARHLAVRGRYLRLTALPDRWVSWWFGAVASGLRFIRRYRPDVLWSTYPIATAHLVAMTLHRLTGLPWVADFRDSMTEDAYPRDPRQRGVYRWIEKRTVRAATCSVFTTPGAVDMYQRRYPECASRLAIVMNGYDERVFEDADRLTSTRISNDGRTVLLHSGVLYPSERDPRSFFAAVARLLRDGQIDSKSLRIVLRATGHDELYRAELAALGIESVVALEPALPYRAALREMLDADGLLLFQGADCNHQIPAKVYEYLRARRPILGLTDASGDTARLLESAGLKSIVPLDDVDRIEAGLRDFIVSVRNRTAPVPADAEIARHSRRARTEELSILLTRAISSGPVA
jgi:hypothetical protein